MLLVTLSQWCGRRRNERRSHLRWIWSVIDASTFVHVLTFLFLAKTTVITEGIELHFPQVYITQICLAASNPTNHLKNIEQFFFFVCSSPSHFSGKYGNFIRTISIYYV